VLNRIESDDQTGKFLLRPRWAGAIDTVGGNTLATLLKACSEHGNVAACGNVSSPLLHTSVFPFILNGVNLLGVNSATTPMELRKEIWQHLASDWKPSMLQKISTLCKLEDLNGWIDRILNGMISGRVVLKHQ
jgi:NADPH:quinone reductase-like Zn-dependent oxidoreductase